MQFDCMTASRDGHLVPETSVGEVTMSAADELGVPDTVMRFRHADGTPYPQTIGGQTASDWGLKQIDPSDPSAGYVWEPLP